MLNAKQLEQQLRLGEDDVADFKSVVHSGFRMKPHDLAKAISALANTRGGHVLLGVEADGTPTGIGTPQQADALLRQVSEVCRQNIHPTLICTVAKLECRGLPILVVEVPGFSPDQPYRTEHVYYVRDAAQSREATRDELVRLLQSEHHHFDERVVRDAGLEALDPAAVREFLTAAYDAEDAGSAADRYLRALHCVDENGNPTVTGILFFSQDPVRWLPDARVTVVRFPGTAVTDQFLDRKELGGRLPQQLDAALAFLTRHVPSPSDVTGPVRAERGIHPKVLREALLNALTHRDYRAASQTCIFVFDDRVELQNPGELLNRLTVDSIRLGSTQRRNPAIATMLNLLNRRESIGMGVPLMLRLMRERGLLEPEFQVGGGHFRLTLRYSPRSS
ncbi:MAG: putative DNA binding domain-containing protein [Planctomycetes bacterium]|nr:putative DNA binding domain-containing protein [Planctomycetota bacterium]